jgi:hypothetical protein
MKLRPLRFGIYCSCEGITKICGVMAGRPVSGRTRKSRGVGIGISGKARAAEIFAREPGRAGLAVRLDSATPPWHPRLPPASAARGSDWEASS